MKHYWWQCIITSIVHLGYRVVAEYEVENDYEAGTQRYTGRSRMRYVSA